MILNKKERDSTTFSTRTSLKGRKSIIKFLELLFLFLGTRHIDRTTEECAGCFTGEIYTSWLVTPGDQSGGRNK